MFTRFRFVIIASLLVSLSFAPLFTGTVLAAEMKIGLMNLQKVLAESTSGKAAREKIEAKQKELQERLQAEEDELKELQDEIEKKSSAWSEDTKKEKALEFQKKRRELKAKSEDARFELKSLQETELEPILKSLEAVVQKYGAANGYTLIMEMRAGLPYYDPSIDISDKLVVELNAVTAK